MPSPIAKNDFSELIPQRTCSASVMVVVCVCVCVCVCVVWGLSMRKRERGGRKEGECESSGSLCPHYSRVATQASMQA